MTKGKKKHKKLYFRGDEWFNAKVAARTREALPRLNKQFALAHFSDSDEELLEYIRQQAKSIGRTANACEVIGGKFIARRLGNWCNAVQAAGLPRPGDVIPLEKRAIYKQEFKRQAQLFKEERKAIKIAKQTANQPKQNGDADQQPDSEV